MSINILIPGAFRFTTPPTLSQWSPRMALRLLGSSYLFFSHCVLCRAYRPTLALRTSPGLALFLLTACCPVVRAAPVGGSLWSPLFLCTSPFGMGATPLAQLWHGFFPCTHFGSPGCHCCNQPLPPSRKFGTLGRSTTTTYCASFLNWFLFYGFFF